MTKPIDTTPEAVAAIIARYTQAFGLASDAYDKGYRNAVKEMAAEIARLNRALNEAFVRAERSQRAERAAHDAANTAIKQRDEARAQVGARDAAMRNEGRRQAAALSDPTSYSAHHASVRRRVRNAILAALEPEGGE